MTKGLFRTLSDIFGKTENKGTRPSSLTPKQRAKRKKARKAASKMRKMQAQRRKNK